MMTPMTGAVALQLIEAMNEAVDAAGSGEWRGLKALQRLRQLGLDICVSEAPAPVKVAASDLGLG